METLGQAHEARRRPTLGPQSAGSFPLLHSGSVLGSTLDSSSFSSQDTEALPRVPRGYSGAIRTRTDGGPDGGWGGSISSSSGAFRGGTHLREEANEKWAGVLGEKLRGLSRGLLPAGERTALGSSDQQNRLLGTAPPSNTGPSVYGRPRPFSSGPASLDILRGLE